MTEFRTVLVRTLAALFVVALAAMPSSARKNLAEMVATPEAVPVVELEFAGILGKSVPADRITRLSSLIRAASLPGSTSGTGADLPIFAVLLNVGGAEAPKYEVSGIPIEIVTRSYTRLRIERAHVVVTPAADGRSCRFEIGGTPFGGASSIKVTGSVEWATGPAGGDKLEIVFALDDAPVDQLRALLPKRFDPTVRGILDLHGHGNGVVGEVTTEEVPATPLKGDVEITADWQLLGRTSRVALTTPFSVDDRSVRLSGGKLTWQGLEAEVRGWFDPAADGGFDLTAKMSNVDTQKVATDWNVPVEWRPASILTGAFTFAGRPGDARVRFEASAPSVVVPGMNGYTIRLDAPKFKGNIAAINADFATSVKPAKLQVGQYDLGNLVGGIQWWRDALQINSQNTILWDGEHDGNISYHPERHPAWTMNGVLTKATAPKVVQGIAPWLGLDVEGSAAVAYAIGQDAERNPLYTVHASLVAGRIANVDLFARAMEALAAADPALTLPDMASLLPPRRASGGGTRVDKFFLQIARNTQGFDLGGIFLRSGDFQFDADGRCGPDGEIRLDGTIAVPEAVTAKLLDSAPWLSALRVEGAGLFVPIVVGGKTSAPTVSLAPDYGRLLANAKNGQPVTPPGAKQPRKVGTAEVGGIPGDPSNMMVE